MVACLGVEQKDKERRSRIEMDGLSFFIIDELLLVWNKDSRD